jgi:spore coat polysaccharide biosynthesis predicted glycosyltransferase SpsG
MVHVIGDDFVENMLKDSGFAFQHATDVASAIEAAREFQPDIVFFDMLSLEESDFKSISSSALTISISPIFDRMKSVDVVFHRSAYHDAGWPTGSGSPDYRCGRQYAVINGNAVPIETSHYENGLKQDGLSVAIAMGGVDASNKTLKLLEVLRDLPNHMTFWAMLGEGYDHSYEALVETISESKQHEIIMAKTNRSMWKILGSCSVAILGGGTTTYEAVYAGLPSINIMEDTRHEFVIKELVDAGICWKAEFPLENAVSEVAEKLSELDATPEVLLDMHRKSRGFVDGLGAQRIAEESLEILRG